MHSWSWFVDGSTVISAWSLLFWKGVCQYSTECYCSEWRTDYPHWQAAPSSLTQKDKLQPSRYRPAGTNLHPGNAIFLTIQLSQHLSLGQLQGHSRATAPIQLQVPWPPFDDHWPLPINRENSGFLLKLAGERSPIKEGKLPGGQLGN